MGHTLQQLSDLAEISALRPRFGHAADRRDFAAMATLIAPEVEADLSAFGVPKGRMPREAFVAIFRHAFRDESVATQQLYASITVDLDGDKATSTSYLHGIHTAPDGDRFELHAEYLDQVVRLPEGWRIAGTQLRVISLSGNLGLFS
jgi:hypothetical protein